MRSAAARREHGRPNVGNVINLAQLEADLGHGEEALRVLAELPADGTGMTAYGRMQWHEALLSAAVAKGDSALAARSLEYLHQHQADHLGVYETALVRMKQLDEAATLLIRRLQNPETRRAALLDVQRYRDPPASPATRPLRERWRQVVERPDVREAIAAVGRVLEVPLPRPVE